MAFIARDAGAGVGIYRFRTRSAVLARRRFTLVNVRGAVELAAVPSSADAHVLLQIRSQASAVVEAWIGGTLIDIEAVGPVVGGVVPVVASARVRSGTRMIADGVQHVAGSFCSVALIYLVLAIVSVVTTVSDALTTVSIHLVNASPVVEARTRGTLVVVHRAVATRIAGCADADVCVD
jgi:hypothetical protein